MFDSTEDVLPFLASADDPFGGTAGQGYTPGDPSTGDIGGMGFRARSKPIIFVVTDDFMRDPDLGEASGGGCPGDAGSGAVIAAGAAIDATFIGLTINNPPAQARMETLAEAMGSLGDVDGDGVANEPLAFQYTPGDSDLMETLSRVLTDLTADLIEVNRVWAEVAEDEHGFVASITPTYEGVSESHVNGDVLDFVITLRGAVPEAQEAQAFPVLIDVLTEEGTLDTVTVIVSVPGR